MWSLKFRVRNEDSIYTVLTNKHNVTDYFYPVNFYNYQKGVRILGLHRIEGDEGEKKRFAADLKKHKKTIEFEQQEDLILVLMQEEEPFYELMYSQVYYHPSPVVIAGGVESWHVASWDRRKLDRLISTLARWKKKFLDIQVISIKKTDLHEIYFPRAMPHLAPQQKRAFEIAVNKGYYDCPRQTRLELLAKEMGLCISTYQEHLQKAEAKLLPFFAEGMGKGRKPRKTI